MESRMVVARSWGEEAGGLLFTGYRALALESEKSSVDGQWLVIVVHQYECT